MSLVTRRLDIDDFPDFLDLAHACHQECEPLVEFGETTIVANMFQCIHHPTRNRFEIWVCLRNKKMIGLGVATADEGFYTPELQSNMHYWYVLPEFRGSRAAAELLRAFERWSRSIGAVRMHLGAERFDTVKADEVNHMIAKRGFTKYGEQFYKGLQ